MLSIYMCVLGRASETYLSKCHPFFSCCVLLAGSSHLLCYVDRQQQAVLFILYTPEK